MTKYFFALFILFPLLFNIDHLNALECEMPLSHRQESLLATHTQTTSPKFDDLMVIQRLVNAYRIKGRRYQNSGSTMWQTFFNARHAPLHYIFSKGTLEEVAYILRNPHCSELFCGFDTLTVSTQAMLEETAKRQEYINVCMDCLLRLAEAIGAIPLENPEVYDHIPIRYWDADTVVNKINQVLGVTVTFPNIYPYEHGIASSYGTISYRAIQALYQAYRLKQLLIGIDNPRVLEIGAGLGRTAYYARLLGIKDYTIVDIPFTSLSSGYFLGVTLGEQQILFSGEQAVDAQERVKFLTPEEFLASDKTYNVILNADGFTELEHSIAQLYWMHSELSTPLFLSINHEANSFNVKMLIDKSQNVKEVTRYPSWMRHGYVEEVVRFQ